MGDSRHIRRQRQFPRSPPRRTRGRSSPQNSPPQRSAAPANRRSRQASRARAGLGGAHAKLVLEAAATEIPASILGIALRQCPELPPTIAERITNYRASNVADWVMYRRALAAAADARGWPVHWFDPRKVEDLANKALASKALGVKNLDAHFAQLRKSIGPPWTQDHKMAMAATIVAMHASFTDPLQITSINNVPLDNLAEL